MKKLSTRFAYFQNLSSNEAKIDDDQTTQYSNSRSSQETFNKEGFNMCQVLGNIGNAFIICHFQGKIYLVDQHAASEKSLYIRFLNEKNLLPQNYEGKPFEVENIYNEVLEQQKSTLKLLGWQYEILKKGSVFITLKLTSAPSNFDSKNKQYQFQEVIQNCYKKAIQDFSKTQKQAIATVACHSAYRIGDQLSQNDMRALVDTLYHMAGAFNCPHGRPIIVSLGDTGQFQKAISQVRSYTLF